MQFLLTGFTPGDAFRVYEFQGVDTDRTRTDFTVRTDLSLIRRYGIRMQELPLLCLGLLERRDAESGDRTLTFTEDEMRIHAGNCAAERDAAKLKKAARRPPSS
jgi:hypothetical protein